MNERTIGRTETMGKKRKIGKSDLILVRGGQRMKYHPRELSTLMMGSGGKDKPNLVIQDGIIKRYVGIGWIDEGNATKEDYKKIPKVVYTWEETDCPVKGGGV